MTGRQSREVMKGEAVAAGLVPGILVAAPAAPEPHFLYRGREFRTPAYALVLAPSPSQP